MPASAGKPLCWAEIRGNILFHHATGNNIWLPTWLLFCFSDSWIGQVVGERLVSWGILVNPRILVACWLRLAWAGGQTPNTPTLEPLLRSAILRCVRPLSVWRVSPLSPESNTRYFWSTDTSAIAIGDCQWWIGMQLLIKWFRAVTGMLATYTHSGQCSTYCAHSVPSLGQIQSRTDCICLASIMHWGPSVTGMLGRHCSTTAAAFPYTILVVTRAWQKS